MILLDHGERGIVEDHSHQLVSDVQVQLSGVDL